MMANQIMGQYLTVKAMHDQSVTVKGFCYFIGRGELRYGFGAAMFWSRYLLGYCQYVGATWIRLKE